MQINSINGFNAASKVKFTSSQSVNKAYSNNGVQLERKFDNRMIEDVKAVASKVEGVKVEAPKTEAPKAGIISKAEAKVVDEMTPFNHKIKDTKVIKEEVHSENKETGRHILQIGLEEDGRKLHVVFEKTLDQSKVIERTDYEFKDGGKKVRHYDFYEDGQKTKAVQEFDPKTDKMVKETKFNNDVQNSTFPLTHTRLSLRSCLC